MLKMKKILFSILPVLGMIMAIRHWIEMAMNDDKGNYALGHTADGIILLGIVILLLICISALLYIWLPTNPKNRR